MPDAAQNGHPIPKQCRPEVDWISDLIRSLKPGAIATYQELSARAGVSIQSHRWLLESAAKKLRREDAILIESIRNVGIRRLDAEGKALRPGTRLRRIHSQARQGRKDAATLTDDELNSLPQSVRASHYAAEGLCGVMEVATRARRIKVLEGAAERRQGKLDFDGVLAALKG